MAIKNNPKINIAMPVAHVTGTGTYADWYEAGACIFSVSNYFNIGGSQGISLSASAAASGVTNTAVWNLYALTDGFLSFQNNCLVLRLPRQMNNSAYNSGALFLKLTPAGPQLRHVVYVFSAAPSKTAVEDRINLLLSDAAHPGRTITMVADAPGGTVSLGTYLAANASNLGTLVQNFITGNAEIFVQAGDLIGDFQGLGIEIRFRDSCGNLNPSAVTGCPSPPAGRPLNPSYFLYIVRTNSTRVNLLTSTATTPSHPLNYLFSAVNIPAAGNTEQALDVTAAHPPKPLHVTIAVKNAAGLDIADRGISIDALGTFHNSRNFPEAGGTVSPVQWRNYGNQSGDTTVANYCQFMTQVKPGKDNLLPGPGVFDHSFAPGATHTDRVQSYWQRYHAVLNAVARAFEIPCELLLAIACQETSTGLWYNATPSSSHEMDVIRMEPLQGNPTSSDPAQQLSLTNYQTITAPGGANPKIPSPWNGGAAVQTGNDLTWDQLADLISNFPNNVLVSPGIMQSQVGVARSDLTWVNAVYGVDYVSSLSVIQGGVTLHADPPPASLSDMFSLWFGVAVNSTGVTAVSNIDPALTQLKRAFHNVVAGAAHLKIAYNTPYYPSSKGNEVCDFDLPTMCSGHNDGADVLTTVGTNDTTKWKFLFAMRVKDQNYPKDGPRFFNAAVQYFNANPAYEKPALRLWRP